ncbi:hypothetical protein Dbac_2964 [Desulfomicrobium baculatum DSM 4028]|uniref:Uncharacterized protein n=1 Tax=Desulfomicrobium baculatum (strain DSM 4028 / VKM B-1378 / X) TaxID=525897 RepID=C7LV35_DESBD|nr:hypothetical protein Dbac_2964 [Desulfomicrobium baculatum DSM 4028]
MRLPAKWFWMPTHYVHELVIFPEIILVVKVDSLC